MAKRFVEDRIIRMAELPQIVGVSRASLYILIREKAFPAPVKLTGRNATGFRMSEVQRWIEARQRAIAA